MNELELPDCHTFQELFERLDGLAGTQGRTQLQSEIPAKVRVPQDVGTDNRLPLVDDLDVIRGVAINKHAAGFPMMVGCILVACPAASVSDKRYHGRTNNFDDIVRVSSRCEHVDQRSLIANGLNIEDIEQALLGNAHAKRFSRENAVSNSSLKVARILPLFVSPTTGVVLEWILPFSRFHLTMLRLDFSQSFVNCADPGLT